MAAKKSMTTEVKVIRRRDGDNTPVYVCVAGGDGETISTRVPLNVAIELDNNIITSLKRRTEMVRETSAAGETLVQEATYFIEKI